MKAEEAKEKYQETLIKIAFGAVKLYNKGELSEADAKKDILESFNDYKNQALSELREKIEESVFEIEDPKNRPLGMSESSYTGMKIGSLNLFGKILKVFKQME